MKILVQDSLEVACFTLARELNETLRHETLCAFSTQETLRFLAIHKDAIGVIVHALDLTSDAGFVSIQRIREFCKNASIRSPQFLVLSAGSLTDRYIERFKIIPARLLLLGYVQQVCETVREMIYDAVRENGRPTIFVDRAGPVSRFSVLGVVASELIRCGPRLLPMMNCFAVNYCTELPTVTLAEVADITVPSVRVYMKRLRKRFDEARMIVGINTPAREVFCTLRRDGAFVHTLKARVLFS